MQTGTYIRYLYDSRHILHAFEGVVSHADEAGLAVLDAAFMPGFDLLPGFFVQQDLASFAQDTWSDAPVKRCR